MKETHCYQWQVELLLIRSVRKRIQRGGNLGRASFEPDGWERLLVGVCERSQRSEGSCWGGNCSGGP